MSEAANTAAEGRSLGRRFSSLRARLVVTTLVITGALVMISLGTSWILLRQVAHDHSKDAANAISSLLSHSVAAGLDFDLRRSVRETLSGVFRIGEIDFAAVTTSDGNLYETLGDVPEKTLLDGRPEQIEIGRWKDLYVAHAPILDTSGGRIGTLHIGYSLEEMQAALRRGLYTLLLAGLVLMVAGIYVTWRFGCRLTAPILALAGAARDVAGGRFGRQLEVRRNDEVGVVARTFNEMAARLDEAYRGLEQKVQERTAELRRTNMELAVQNEKVMEVSRLKSAFLANMSHELRTPLNAILALSEILRDEVVGPLANEEQRSQIAMIHRSGENLLNLINEVLDLSKIEAGKITIEYSEIDLIDVLTVASRSLEGLARAKGIGFRVSFAGEGMVWGDPNRILQIFHNLVGNAIKFTEEGSVEVSGELDRENELLTITIRDTGIGIAPEEHERIFQEFRQVDGSVTRRFGGTGLGLAISRRLVRLMGGEIAIESEVGKGSIFTFQVPVFQEEPEATPSSLAEDVSLESLRHAVAQKGRPAEEATRAGESPIRSPFAMPETAPDGSPYGCILIVDDDETLLNALARYLVHEGFEIQMARNGKEALEELERRTPDLMVLDLMMPGMSGFEVIEALRGSDERARVPVVVYTAKDLSKEEQQSLQRSVTKVLHKDRGGIRLLLENIHGLVDRKAA